MFVIVIVIDKSMCTQLRTLRSCSYAPEYSFYDLNTNIDIIFNTLCGSNVVMRRFIRKALHSLTGSRVISTFSVRIELP